MSNRGEQVKNKTVYINLPSGMVKIAVPTFEQVEKLPASKQKQAHKNRGDLQTLKSGIVRLLNSEVSNQFENSYLELQTPPFFPRLGIKPETEFTVEFLNSEDVVFKTVKFTWSQIIAKWELMQALDIVNVKGVKTSLSEAVQAESLDVLLGITKSNSK